MSYSADLRERAVLEYEHGKGTRGATSNLFTVGSATLGRWIRQYREEGTLSSIFPPIILISIRSNNVGQKSKGT